jgi:hypothetical protein
MDIFNTPQPITSAEQEAINLAEKNRIALDVLKVNYKESFTKLWANENATSQEILDVYGTNAVKLFLASKKTAELIKFLDPTYEAPVTPKEFTINNDGSVTIVD